MKYYELMYDAEKNQGTTLLEINERSLGFNRYDVETGEMFVHWNPDIEIEYKQSNHGYFTDLLANDMDWLLITERFKILLEVFNLRTVQFLPVTAKSHGGKELLNAYLINICNIIDALNLKKSEHTKHGIGKNRWISIEKYVLNKSKLEGYDIFRLKGFTNAVFVSERIVKAIKEHKITGCDFVEVKVLV